jgi:hypothetical protein
MAQHIGFDELHVQGGAGDFRWDSVVYRYDGGKYAVMAVSVFDSRGRFLRRLPFSEGTHETLEAAEIEVDRIALAMIG